MTRHSDHRAGNVDHYTGRGGSRCWAGRAAYIPQIWRLIRARCSAGISRLAFAVWLLASLLTTAHAIAIHAGVFVALGGIQIVATTLIMRYATRYKDTPCPADPARPPGGMTATST
jgi:PQ loop repeat